MNELQKAAAGLLYDANHDPAVLEMRLQAKVKLHDFHALSPANVTARQAILRSLLGRIGARFTIEGPFHCDYGFNIGIGDDFYANVNLVILDGAPVTIGHHVFVAPNVGLYTAAHPLDAARRNQGLEYALPITIGDHVWIGAGVSVMPGVSIGSGSMIGAGSVVTRDIPAGVVAVGNPCRVLRATTEADARQTRFAKP
ncbi:maltose acetyltransferase [Comamonas serinivorans]|uniref:Acetyltransferase n=1 Tax=Comamonas serinivorans TaxID=1082851 RepID=A0A1Y0EP53_9BURK|nr:sugar O-acetyltransferase [Comamonas serinivorans]ARU05407.1 maltose acetyltransferase [Comamonas serinivorans]